MARNKNTKGIMLELNEHQWGVLSRLFEMAMMYAPVDNFELETLLLGESFKKRNQALTYFTPKTNGRMTFTLSDAEAYALHNLYMDRHVFYDANLRIFIEPYLKKARSNFKMLINANTQEK